MIRRSLFASFALTVAACSSSSGEPTDNSEAQASAAFDWRDAVIYFAFVDRFNDGNPALNDGCRVKGVSSSIVDYQGGDWSGVTKKIEEGYFNELGVNTLWITVPFENVAALGKGVGGDDHLYSGYHGYWPKIDSSDPEQLAHESCFGSFDDLKNLVSTAHAKGLKVLFDYAMVHVHESSALYQVHRNWFWPNTKDGHDCICGQACSWEADGDRCWFTNYLPHWNYTNPQARAWSVDNAIAWVKQTGVDGFRADAIKHVDISWLNELRQKLSPEHRFYIVGETYDFWNRDLLKAYVDPKTKLDGQFDFPLRRALVESAILRTSPMTDLAGYMDSNDGFYGADAVMSTFIGNHDLPRIIHLGANQPLWGQNQSADGKDRAWSNQPGHVNEREAYERVANGFALLFTNRGAPLVYYGDEIGLPGAGDPDNRRPMQWSGLTSDQTWLRDRIKRFAKIRSEYPALRRGTRTTLEATSDTWVFKQTLTGSPSVAVAINRSDTTVSVHVPELPLTELVENQPSEGGTVVVPPRQTRIYVLRGEF